VHDANLAVPSRDHSGRVFGLACLPPELRRLRDVAADPGECDAEQFLDLPVIGSIGLAAVLASVLLGPSLLPLSLILAFAGVAFGLVNVALFELLDLVVPGRNAVEALTWVTTAEGVGLAAGATGAGAAAVHSPSGVLLILALAPSAGAAVALTRRSSLYRAKREAP
jgi:hypothetical protein